MSSALAPDTFTAEEMMAVAAARRLPDGVTCFVGIGAPSPRSSTSGLASLPGPTR